MLYSHIDISSFNPKYIIDKSQKMKSYYASSAFVTQMQIRHDGKHGEERFEIVPWLKEEKGAPRGGRMILFFNDDIPNLLNEIREIQTFFKIESEWIFPNTDCLSYERSIYQLCKKLGYEITNNHAFRKGFNMRMMDM